MRKRTIINEIISCIFGIVPLSVLSKLTGVKVLATVDHMVSDDDVIHVKNVMRYNSIKRFGADVDFLLRKFVPISLFDLLDSLEVNKSLPDRAILITFDDGFKEMYEIVAPILLKKGVPATFFINSGFIDNRQLAYECKASILIEYFRKETNLESITTLNKILTEIGVKDIKSIIASPENQAKRPVLGKIAEFANIDFDEYLSSKRPYLTSEQVKELINSGFTIGAHSIDHPIYSALSLDEQLHQTRESLRFVKDNFNLHYGAFSFPQTDDDVSRDFFIKLHNEGIMDVSFGTRRMIGDSIPSNYQRFGLANSMPAKKIITTLYVRRLYGKLMGKEKILRTPYKPDPELNG